MKKMTEIFRINFSRYLENQPKDCRNLKGVNWRKTAKHQCSSPSPSLSCMIAFKNNLLKVLVQSSSHQRECNGTESFTDSFPKNCYYLTCMMVLQKISTCKVISIWSLSASNTKKPSSLGGYLSETILKAVGNRWGKQYNNRED